MNTDLREKERVAIERLKAFEPEDGYFLAYSGGKDSDCIKILAQLAGVKFEAVHNLTTSADCLRRVLSAHRTPVTTILPVPPGSFSSLQQYREMRRGGVPLRTIRFHMVTGLPSRS